MTVDEAMARLETLGSEKMRKMNAKSGVGDNQFGVMMGDIRNLAKEIKLNPELAKQLWSTGNVDAMFLATQLMKPKELSTDDLERLARDVTFANLADWLISYVIKAHPQKEQIREPWMDSDHPTVARAGWSLTAERLSRNPDGLDVEGLLDRIEKEMGSAPELARWTMNFALLEIGVNFPPLRDRAITIGEKIGAYRDYPTSKGCTSPFAPLAIRELSKRKEQ